MASKKKKAPAKSAKKKEVGERKKPVPPAEYTWKKGESGNPEGRPPDSPEMKKLKTLTKKELADVGNLIINGNFQELIRIKQEVRTEKSQESALKVMMASVAMRIISRGDMGALDILLNRLIGKVKDEVHLNGNMNSNVKVLVTLPSNGREAPKT